MIEEKRGIFTCDLIRCDRLRRGKSTAGEVIGLMTLVIHQSWKSLILYKIGYLGSRYHKHSQNSVVYSTKLNENNITTKKAWSAKVSKTPQNLKTKVKLEIIVGVSGWSDGTRNVLSFRVRVYGLFLSSLCVCTSQANGAKLNRAPIMKAREHRKRNLCLFKCACSKTRLYRARMTSCTSSF